MGSYKANKNNLDTIDEKIQDEKNEQAIQDVLKTGLDVVEHIPVASMYAKAAKIADKATGGAITKGASKVVNQGLKNSPIVNQTQSVKNSPSESEINNTESKTTNITNSNSLFKLNGKTSTSLTDGNIMGKISSKIPKSIKIKIYVGLGVFLFFIMLFVTVFAEDDEINLGATNNISLSSKEQYNSKKCSEEEIEDRLVYVGDYRVTGLQSAIENENTSYISETGSGYDWLVNSALSDIDNKITDSPNSVIVLSLGLNDLSNVENYINEYNNLINKYPNNTIYIMSVNPVDESKITPVTNTEIEEFNKQLSSNFPNNYIDTYSSLSNFNTNDGLYYDDETNKNLNDFITNNISNSGKVLCSNAGGDLIAKLEEVGNWYIANVNTYQNSTSGKATGKRKMYQTPFGTRKFGDDCSEFAIAYMSYVAGTDLSKNNSAGMIHKEGDWAKEANTVGWIAYTTDEIDSIIPGDVLVSNPVISYSRGNHAEIYIDETHTFGWGSIKKNYPTNSTLTKSSKLGHTIYSDWVGSKYQHDYVTVYRFEG